MELGTAERETFIRMTNLAVARNEAARMKPSPSDVLSSVSELRWGDSWLYSRDAVNMHYLRNLELLPC